MASPKVKDEAASKRKPTIGRAKDKPSLVFSDEIVAIADDADRGKVVETAGWDLDAHIAFAASRQRP